MATHVSVVGAGIGGLMAAAMLVKRGYSVKVYDKATTVGGSAGWYIRGKRMYPTGATIAFGLEEDGILRKLLDELDLTSRLQFKALHHPMDVYLPDRKLSIYLDRERWEKELRACFFERADHVVEFWRELSKLAIFVEAVTKTGVSLPIRKWYDLGSLPSYLFRNPRALFSLARYALFPVEHLLKKFNLHDYSPFRYFLNAQLVDAAQTDVQHSALLPSSVALDIYRRGSYAIDGGLAAISRLLSQYILENGGNVELRSEIVDMSFDSKATNWTYSVKHKGTVDLYRTDVLLDASGQRILSERRTAHEKWGAFRLDIQIKQSVLKYLDIPSGQLPFAWQIVPSAQNAALFGDKYGPIYFTLHHASDQHGVRLSDEYTLTASVHTDIHKWQGLSKSEYTELKQQFSEAMLSEFERVCPSILTHMICNYQGSPLTYQTFIGKVEVGGTPLTVRHAILQPRGAVAKHHKSLFYAGEQVFPGPGTLSCALSGSYAVRAIAHLHPLQNPESRGGLTH